MRARLIGLSKIMDGIQSIILCQPGTARNQYQKRCGLIFIVYDLKARLVPLNERPTGDLTYLSRYIEISVALHDTLGKEELVYLVDKNPECLVQRFIEAVTEAKSNSCRCFEAVSISLRFPNAS